MLNFVAICKGINTTPGSSETNIAIKDMDIILMGNADY